MKTIAALLSALGLVAGISACGTSTSSNSNGGGENETVKPKESAKQGEAQAQQLAVQAQRMLQQTASAAGNLASGSSSEKQHAREMLRRLQSEGMALKERAKSQLKAGSAAQSLVTQAGQEVNAASGALQHMSESESETSRKGLQLLKGALNTAAGEVGSVRTKLNGSSAAKVAGDLEAVSQQIANGAQ